MKPYNGKLDKLLAEYGTSYIPYSKLLQTKEWQAKREIIIRRDRCCCAICGKEATAWMDGRDGPGWTPGHYWMDGDWCMGDCTGIKLAGKSYHLEVHHRFYVHNHYPWDYPDTALQTLCNWCHQLVHQQTVVPYYSEEGQALGYKPCTRCNGAGSFLEYTHVQSGVCFRCNGARYEELIQTK